MARAPLYMTCIMLFMVIWVGVPAFGHGLGFDTLTTVIDGNSYKITAHLPDRFDDATKRFIITMNSVTSEEAPDMVVQMGITHQGRYILEDTFLAAAGILNLDITTDEGEVRIVGERQSGALVGIPKVAGSAFTTGGLYTIQLQPVMVDGVAIQDNTVHILDLLVTDTTSYTTTSMNGSEISFTTKSYFDVISEFKYDSAAGIIEFRMPFDWTAGRMSHIPVLHMEVRFPSNLTEFVTRGYGGAINGVDLFRSSLAVDDFTTLGERTVHFVLLQDHINLIKAQMEKPGGNLPDYMVFTLESTEEVRSQMSAYAPNGDYQVDMTWEPELILPDQNTKFIFTIRDAYTGETLRNSDYDFILIQGGDIIYKDSGVARIGGDFRDYTFTEEQAGTATVRLENIRGTDQYVEFVFAVAPEFGAVAALVLVGGVGAAAILSRFGQTGSFRKYGEYLTNGRSLIIE